MISNIDVGGVSHYHFSSIGDVREGVKKRLVLGVNGLFDVPHVAWGGHRWGIAGWLQDRCEVCQCTARDVCKALEEMGSGVLTAWVSDRQRWGNGGMGVVCV